MPIFNEYYTARHMLAKKAIFNLALSDRSDGKTYDCKFRMLEDFAKDGTIGLYVRRFKTEMGSDLYDNFYEEVLETPQGEPFREWEFKYSYYGVKVKKTPDSKWEQLSYFMPLTMAGKKKSKMRVLKIKTINYDEFIPLDGQYLPDEPSLLLELYKSVDRDREIVQLAMFGNRISPFCPILDYFGIELDITKEKIKMYRNDTFAVQIYVCEEHREKRKNSRFNYLVKGTKYEDYEQGGILKALNFKTGVKAGGIYIMSFMSNNGEGSIWNKDGLIIISSQKRKDGYVITEELKNSGREEYLINFGGFRQFFKRNYGANNIAFENQEAYHKFEPILRKIHN